MRRIIIFVILIILLLATFRLSRLARDWHYVVPSNARTVLYATSFEDAAEMWQQDERSDFSHVIRDEAMYISIERNAQRIQSLAQPHFGDFDLRLTARTVSGSFSQENTNAFGVIFRQYDRSGEFQSDLLTPLVERGLQTLTGPLGLIPEQDGNNYYMFLISGDGWYQVLRVQDGQKKVLSAWNPSEAINQGIGAVNTLRITGHGETFGFYVNGQRLELCIPNDPEATSTINPLDGSCMEGQWQDTLIEPTHRTGRIGVVVDARAGEDSVVVAFDDVVITAPADEPSEQTAAS